ncbi:hypothetical protein HNR31_003685 [Anoxybacillus caldiproteolyticus]|uniref:Uncharacterized protein n=1 Tax=Thermaerobacillus caldiproteolyticus TaxID=247480 RepID=A0A7V9ZA59_9BACL|nr:hypothetical protein [Anoxybacillus caldiproteolyticus]
MSKNTNRNVLDWFVYLLLAMAVVRFIVHII